MKKTRTERGSGSKTDRTRVRTLWMILNIYAQVTTGYVTSYWGPREIIKLKNVQAIIFLEYGCLSLSYSCKRLLVSHKVNQF